MRKTLSRNDLIVKLQNLRVLKSQSQNSVRNAINLY